MTKEEQEERGKIVISNFIGGILGFWLMANVGLSWGSSLLGGVLVYKLFNKLNYIVKYSKEEENV